MSSRSGWVSVATSGFLSAVLILTSIPLLAKGFQPGQLPEYPVGLGPFYAVAADLRNTGRKDLIVANSAVSNGLGTSNTISVIDAKTAKVVANVFVDARPRGVLLLCLNSLLAET